LDFCPHLSPYPWSSNFREPRQGEVHHSPGPEGPVPPPAATEKPGRSGRGKDSEGARLDDKSDCSIDEAPSTYAKWPIFVCQVATFAGVAEGQSTGPLQEDGGLSAAKGFREPGRDGGGKPRPDYRLPNLTSWPLGVVNIRCSGVKARFDAGRCVL
jgi:hypothetical protein